MAVARITTAAVQAVSNQKLTIAGALDTELAARPAYVTSVIIKANQAQSATRYFKLFNLALSTDVNADHITALTMALVFGQQSEFGEKVFKYIFPRGLSFNLGVQCAIDTTIGGNTAAATTTLPEEVLVFFEDI
jgi:hypothetical protein